MADDTMAGLNVHEMKKKNHVRNVDDMKCTG